MRRLILSLVTIALVAPAVSAQRDPLAGFDAFVSKAVNEWRVPGLANDWQAALIERDLTPMVQLRLELDGDDAARERAVQEVHGALQRTRPEAWLAYCQRLIDLEVIFFAPGTLREGRKLLRLVDERLTGPPAWVARAVQGIRPR